MQIKFMDKFDLLLSKSLIKRGCIVAVALGAISTSVVSVKAAAAFSQPLPSNTYITFLGLDWAWAAPVSSVDWPLPLDFKVQ